MSIDDSIRRQLVILSRRARARDTAFSPRRPTEWQPWQVVDPHGAFETHFTEPGAWELIASELEAGHDVEVVRLRQPPGQKAYVMKIKLDDVNPLLYVKLQLGAGKVIGRSFHYSTLHQEGE